MALKENYKDDILDTSQNVKRKYQMENNGDGTVSFTDVTEYTQQGDSFGASDMNATNGKVNTLDSAVTALDANLDGFKFYPSGTDIVGLIADDSAYTDEDGNYVVWGTATANQLVEDNPNTYKSVPSEEDTRGKEGEDTAMSFGGGNSRAKCAYYMINTQNISSAINLDISNYVAIRICLYGRSAGGNSVTKALIDSQEIISCGAGGEGKSAFIGTLDNNVLKITPSSGGISQVSFLVIGYYATTDLEEMSLVQ